MSDLPSLPVPEPSWSAPDPGGSAPPAPLMPWEDPATYPSFWSRVGAMFSLLFSDPMGFFDRVPQSGGLMKPWQFLMLLLTPVWMILLLVFAVLGVVGTAGLLSQKGSQDVPVWIFSVLMPVILLLMPLFVFLGMLLGGALNHFFLWMWGGLKQGHPLEQTIRAQGYAHAFINLGGLIPYLGILVQLAGLVWMGMGLARMHRTDTWRGVCAALTPVFFAILCCFGILAIALPAMLAGGMH